MCNSVRGRNQKDNNSDPSADSVLLLSCFYVYPLDWHWCMVTGLLLAEMLRTCWSRLAVETCKHVLRATLDVSGINTRLDPAIEPWKTLRFSRNMILFTFLTDPPRRSLFFQIFGRWYRTVRFAWRSKCFREMRFESIKRIIKRRKNHLLIFINVCRWKCFVIYIKRIIKSSDTSSWFDQKYFFHLSFF